MQNSRILGTLIRNQIDEPTFLRFVKHCTNPFKQLRRNILFCPETKRSLDFGWPTIKLGIEIQGGIFGHSRRSRQGHAAKSGLVRDYRKLADAQYLGWQLLWLTPDDITTDLWKTYVMPTIAEHMAQLLKAKHVEKIRLRNMQ